MATKRYKIQVTVVKATNGCSLGFKEGDTWLITNKTPGGMCLSAYATIYPNIRTLRYGGGGDRSISRVSCPDPNHCVVYEVKRIDE
jgi:uncharacterized repeat protein (TIGR04076 family)